MLHTRPRRVVAAALVALTLTAGCGNRVPHDRVAAVGNGYGPVDAQSDNAVSAPVTPGALGGGVGISPDTGVPGTTV
ncbi:MAG TPA: ABC transporter substrate-binding protein, partial [Sporichthya sp.]|nr:ABC transporter substrate-binding protein [Sporichthya sp.]